MVLGKISGDPAKGSVKQKGVDTQIVADIITLGLDKKYDVAYLISSDWDLMPAVEYVQKKGRRVSYIYFHYSFCKTLYDICCYRQKIVWPKFRKFCKKKLRAKR